MNMIVLALVASAALPPPTQIPPALAATAVLWVTPQGSQDIVHMALLNPTTTLSTPVAGTLYARIYIGGQTAQVDLHRIGPAAEIPAGGWTTADYLMNLPASARGMAVLSFDNADQGFAFKADPADR